MVVWVGIKLWFDMREDSSHSIPHWYRESLFQLVKNKFDDMEWVDFEEYMDDYPVEELIGKDLLFTKQEALAVFKPLVEEEK